MKILVFSDSHDVTSNMVASVEHEKPQMVLHLGDHEQDREDIALLYPDIVIRAVRGNCDRGSLELEVDEFVIDGKRFLMTHGHQFGVKMGLGRLREYAGNVGADIVLFGHTHQPFNEKWIDGITYINPGSIGLGSKSYAVLTLQDGAIQCEIKYVRDIIDK